MFGCNSISCFDRMVEGIGMKFYKFWMARQLGYVVRDPLEFWGLARLRVSPFTL